VSGAQPAELDGAEFWHEIAAHDALVALEAAGSQVGARDRLQPAFQELGQGFLEFLQDELELPGRYADPDLALEKHSGEIPKAMLAQISAELDRIRWDEDLASAFIGRHFSEPKPDVFFIPPASPVGEKAFASRLAKNGLKLDSKTRLLFSGTQFFVNGEDFGATGPERKALMQLADTRALPPGDYGDALAGLFYDWYTAGWAHV